VSLTPERLQALQDAEIAHFATKYREPPGGVLTELVYLHQLPNLEIAQALYDRIPAHFAFRIGLLDRYLEQRSCPHLQHVRDIFATSFHEIRAHERPASEDEVREFSDTVERLRRRHLEVVFRLQTGLFYAGRGGRTTSLDVFAYKFFTSRIFTEMLTRLFWSACSKQRTPSPIDDVYMESDETPTWNKLLGTAKVVDIVVLAWRNAEEVSGAGPRYRELEFDGEVDLIFNNIPIYVYFIFVELFLNSLVAYKASQHGGPVRATVVQSGGLIFVRISDQAGGMSPQMEQRCWSMGVTSLTMEELRVGDDGSLNSFTKYSSPLTGIGAGMGLCRMYLQFLGGDLEIMNVPGWGLDLKVSFLQDVSSLK
jgi:hypothetical protein